MTVRPIKKSWWVDFRVNYVRYRKRSPENSRAGAKAYELLLRHKLARGESVDKPLAIERKQTFEQFARQWFDEYVKPNNRYAEERNKKYILRSLVSFFGKMAVGEITSHHTEQYKAQKVKEGLTNKTIRNHLTVLHKCLVTGYEWLELEGTPPEIKWPKCTPPKTDYLSFEESDLLLSYARGITYELILTALRTGMRQGEIKGLQRQSLDWQNRILIVRHSRCDYTKTLNSPKSNRERHIPLDPEVYNLLFQRKQKQGYVFTDEKGRPFNYGSLKRLLKDTCQKAGLRKIGWHTLRHTFASHLVMRGAPLPAVQQLMGHSSITMTMRYAHLAPSLLRETIDLLDPKLTKSDDFGQPVGNRWVEAIQRETKNP